MHNRPQSYRVRGHGALGRCVVRRAVFVNDARAGADIPSHSTHPAGRRTPFFAARYPKFWHWRPVVSDWRQPEHLVAASHYFRSVRAKSLWFRCVPEIRRNPPDISKGIFANVIPRFESWRPSGPLSPLLPVSGLLENERLFRALDWRKRVSGAKHLALLAASAHFCAPVSGRDFSISKICCLRLGSKPLGPVWSGLSCAHVPMFER